jgi:hypothetical protein
MTLRSASPPRRLGSTMSRDTHTYGRVSMRRFLLSVVAGAMLVAMAAPPALSEEGKGPGQASRS